ncbi:MAG TPA: aldo/keto reductase [Terriglobales bacterium]|nr:aldo/keto reductase [Terriglobales bacterium]
MAEIAGNIRTPRRLGRDGPLVSPVGLGCWQFSKGGNLAGRYWRLIDDEEIRRIVGRALELGIDWFDTAEGYGNGESEKALARSLQALGKAPGEVVIATKWNPVLRRASSISRTIGDRLANLAPFPIDLFQIHNPYSVSPLEKQLAAMARLVEDGMVRFVGVSNFSRRRMEKAHRLLAARGLPLVSNQVRYSLLDRSIEKSGVLEAAEDLGVGIIAYSPLAQGLLSGKFHDDPALVRRTPGFRRFMPGFRRRGLERSRLVVEALRRIAPKYGATEAQAALNWLIARHGETVTVIPGASRAAQVDDLAAAMSFRLSESDMEELDRVSASFK